MADTMTNSTVSGVTIETPALSPAHPVRGVLEQPYSIARWRQDLQKLAPAVPTGFDLLDRLDVRWTAGKLYAVAARPGGGKTAFLLEACLRYLEAHPDAHAVFISWEEPLAEVLPRLVKRMDADTECRLHGGNGETFTGSVIPNEAVRACGRNAEHGGAWRERIGAGVHRVGAILDRLRLVDGDELGHDIRAVLEQIALWQREPDSPKVGLVAVDYFQKLKGPRGEQTFSRQAELQAVSDCLRRFAKGATLTTNGDTDTADAAYAVPMLVGAQVTRGQGAHPSGDGIREADDLLNDAAGVLALSWEVSSEEGATEEVRALRVSVPKHRDGRSRPDAFARMMWRPARAFLAPRALHDEKGHVVWTPTATLEGEHGGVAKPKGGKKDARPIFHTAPANTEAF